MDDEDDGEWATRYDVDTLPMEHLSSAADGNTLEHCTEEVAAEEKQHSDHERAVLGDQCPICLDHLNDAAMIKGCYHVYCFGCLAAWVTKLALHGVRKPTCPLCKRVFDAAYVDVISETQFDLVHFDAIATAPASSRSRGRKKKQDQMHGLMGRLMVYQQRMRLARVDSVNVNSSLQSLSSSTIQPVKLAKHEYAKWVERDLRACVGPDVDLTVFISLIDDALSCPVTKNKKAVDWMALIQTLEPFLLDDAARFVIELAFFLSSRLNMQAYDQVIEYCCSAETPARCTIESCPACNTSSI